MGQSISYGKKASVAGGRQARKAEDWQGSLQRVELFGFFFFEDERFNVGQAIFDLIKTLSEGLFETLGAHFESLTPSGGFRAGREGSTNHTRDHHDRYYGDNEFEKNACFHLTGPTRIPGAMAHKTSYAHLAGPSNFAHNPFDPVDIFEVSGKFELVPKLGSCLFDVI